MNDDLKTPMELWLEEQKPSTRKQYRRRFRNFLKWVKTTDEEIFDEWKTTEDRDEFIKKWSSIVLRYYRHWIKKTGKVNTARSYVGAARSFFSSRCGSLRIKKGVIKKAKGAKGEHIFSQSDLMKMFKFGDVREKAILSLAVSLGWSVGDFLSLEREFLERHIRRAREQDLNFIRFDWEREKTGELMMGILTPEAMDCLEEWFKKIPHSRWVFPSNGFGNAQGRSISDDTLNDIIKRLTEEANIVTTGSVRFHLIRKFLMGQLVSAGLNEWETKIILGKAIPVTDLTYLQTIKNDAFEKYCRDAYDKIKLVGFTARNHDRLEQLQARFNGFVTLFAQYLEKKIREPELPTMTEATGKTEKEILEELRRLGIEIVEGEEK